jgi:transposase
MDRDDDAQPADRSELLTRLQELSDKVAALEAQLRIAELEGEKYQAIIARLKRMQFGHSSERHVGQFMLDLDTPGPMEETAPIPAVANDDDSKAHPVRRPLPGHLPREVVRHEPPRGADGKCRCKQCGGALHVIGEDTSEVLDFVPASFRVIRHVRPRLGCRRCETVVQAPAPSAPIERGLPGPGLLAQVLVAKYLDHTPLYRQSRIYARSGVDIDRGTMVGWVGKAAWLLKPLAERIKDHVFAAPAVHTDDTPLPVLAPGHGKTLTGRMWIYLRDGRTHGDPLPPAVAFFYSPDRKGARPAGHLKGFKGYLQADAYAGYDRIYEAGTIVEVGCWAHARRKIHEVYESTQSPVAAEALAFIKGLYGIEARLRGRPPEERQRVRQAESAPLLDRFHAWIVERRAKLPPRGSLSLALGYALGQWAALVRYTTDGRLEIDNNRAENVLRGIALGRKNYLFAGSDTGGENAAIVYTLIEAAKLNGIEPFAYLRDVLGRIADHPINRLDELLPWTWAARQDGAEQAA